MWLGMDAGVNGGVIGSLDRFVAVAPRRWSGVKVFLVERFCLFGARSLTLRGPLVLIAKGILDGRVDADGGVGRPCIPNFDFRSMTELGVDASVELKKKHPLGFPVTLGRKESSPGDGGCSSELVVDIEGVRPGVES